MIDDVLENKNLRRQQAASFFKTLMKVEIHNQTTGVRNAESECLSWSWVLHHSANRDWADICDWAGEEGRAPSLQRAPCDAHTALPVCSPIKSQSFKVQ